MLGLQQFLNLIADSVREHEVSISKDKFFVKQQQTKIIHTY